MAELKSKGVKTATEKAKVDTIKRALAKSDSNINLAVKVIKREAIEEYINGNDEPRSYFPCVVADKTGFVWLRIYKDPERTDFKPEAYLILRGLLRKKCEYKLWYVSTSKHTDGPHVEIPKDVLNDAMKASKPKADTGAMAEYKTKDVETATYMKDRKTGTMAEVKEEDVETATENKDIHDEGVKRLTKHAVYEPDTCKRSNQKRLDDLLAEEDLFSLIKETQEICRVIKSLDPNILDVYAAYKYPKSAPHAVAFIVTVKDDDVNLEHFAQYNIVKRTIHRYSNEGKDVIYSESNKQNQLKAHDEFRLKTTIERNEELLMQRHKYLNMISGSAVRSKCYNENHVIEATICLVLYVHVKGYVPIEETPFRDNYNGIAVDVREGGCWRLNKSINIGEEIERDRIGKSGSIGGFVEVPSIGLCGITSAHVLLTDKEYMQCKQEKRFIATGLQNEFRINTCNEDIGRLISAMYEEGNDREAGFEVAIFHIERLFPFEGIGTSFHGDTLGGVAEEYSFESGHILGKSQFYPDGKCCKYGSESKFTMGKLVSTSEGMGYLSIRERTYDETEGIVLRKQYEVEAFSKDTSFAIHGDSGALVFCWRNPEELVCTGMIVAQTSNKTTIVSPIAPMLKRLGISKLKNFKKVKNERQNKSLHDKVDQMQVGIDALLQRKPPQTALEKRSSDQTNNKCTLV